MSPNTDGAPTPHSVSSEARLPTHHPSLEWRMVTGTLHLLLSSSPSTASHAGHREIFTGILQKTSGRTPHFQMKGEVGFLPSLGLLFPPKPVIELDQSLVHLPESSVVSPLHCMVSTLLCLRWPYICSYHNIITRIILIMVIIITKRIINTKCAPGTVLNAFYVVTNFNLKPK